jgi:uncharacterized membrane protein
MIRRALAYVAVLVILIAGDYTWLQWFAHAVFRPTLGAILLDDPRWGAAALFYLLYALAILIFPVPLAARSGSWLSALLYGALFGFFAYMTYDLTNLASIKAWTEPLALMDTGWGTLLTAAAALVGHEVSGRQA